MGRNTERMPPRALDLDELTWVRSVVALAAHPDDIESWCAATLALLVDQGAGVHVLVATSGEAGDGQVPGSSLSAVREAEANAAARVLGLRPPQFLRLPDGGLARSAALGPACRDLVDALEADLVLTFDPHRPSAAVPHPDHIAIGRAGVTSAPRALWFYATAEPDLAVNITATFARKLSAREAHRSQTSDVAALRVDWRRRAEDIGRRWSVPLAEEFRRA